MPNLLIPIPVTYDTVMRRAVRSVVDKVMKITGIDESTRVEIRGDLGVATQPGGEMGADQATVRRAHDGRVIVTFRETYRESEVINAAVRYPDAQPIFLDEAIGVLVKPIYSATDVEINFTYRAKTRQEAFIWRDDIKIRIADNRQQHLHELEYHFPIPPWISMMLKTVHGMREAQGGYGEGVGEYLKAHYTDRIRVMGAQDGDAAKSMLAVAEKQIGVQGWFDFIEPVEEEKNGEDGPSYLVQFVYRFNYKKPVEMHVQYPLTVHNQLIDPAFIPKPYNEDPDKKVSYRGSYKFFLDTFDYEVRRPPRALGGIAIPDFDEWIPSIVPDKTTSIITWMTCVEQKDLTLFLSEKDVLDTGFHPDILMYMREQGQNLVKKGAAALYFTLYRGDSPISDGDLVVNVTDKAFEIRSKSIPDVRLNYHLRMSFCTSLSLYTEAAKYRLSDLGITTLRMFQTVANRLDVEWAQENAIDEEGKLSIPYIKWFFRFLETQGYGDHPGFPGGNPDATEYGKDVSNVDLDDNAWSRDNNFLNHLDQPYVEILTILAGNSSRGTNNARSDAS
jgi:hypothetical protein